MFLVLAISLVFHQEVSSFEHLYDELENFGGLCFPQDSCLPSRAEDEDHFWGNYTCECGAHCTRYGTCCANSPHVGTSLQAEYRGESCKKFPLFSHEYAVVVSKCSDRWWETEFRIRSKCEETDDNAEDPLSVVPMTSNETYVTYKNYFCALCNYDTEDAFFWDLALHLKTTESSEDVSDITKAYLLENLIYNREHQSWGVMINSAFYDVKLQFKIPSHLRKIVKKCYPNMIIHCDRSHSYNFELHYKCLSYYAPVKIRQKGKLPARTYRNIHCAICNNVNITGVDSSICKLDTVPRRKKPGFSFAHLIDMNTSDGDLVGRVQLCEANQQWDPFFKKCRTLACALPGYVIKNGKCVQS